MTFRDDFDSVKKKYSIRTYSFIGFVIIVSIILGFGIFISKNTNDINKLYEIDKTLSLVNNEYDDIRSNIKIIRLLKDKKNNQIGNLESEIESINNQVLDNIEKISRLKLDRFIDENYLEIEKITSDINSLNKTLKSKEISNSSIVSLSLIDSEIEMLIYEINELDKSVVNAQKSINKSVNYLIRLFLVSILLIILLCYSLLRNKIIKPLSNISTELRINAFNFKTKSMKVETKDEIGFLIHNYNYLRNRIVAIEELNSQINSKVDFESVLNYLFDDFKFFIPYSRIGSSFI